MEPPYFQEGALARMEAVSPSPARAWALLARFVRRKPLGALGGLVMCAFVVAAIAASLLAPYSPEEIHRQQRFEPPGAQFVLGTDHLGRDILSRIIFGAQVSLLVGATAVVTGTSLGTVLGVVSGYAGGKIDALIQRAIETVMAFPLLVLALTLVTALGPSLWNVTIAISVILLPEAARVIRGQALSVKENQYVEAARAVGCTNTRIVFRHILPQCVASAIVLASVQLGYAIVVEATLSFLGVGTPPPETSWGAMLSGLSRLYLEKAPWMAIFPGVALTATVFGVNLFGDALRDVLDPRLRGR
ncbi:MAG: ABC transporter permease [Chloroflexi bacterium]|nr:ABC transporter permease [Chloroflexota bacterium]